VRTPIFKHFINQYFDSYIFPAPDSIILKIDEFIEKASKGSPLMYKYALTSLYDKYSKSQIMGYDKILVHIAEKYFLSGKAPWLDEEATKKLKDYIEDIRLTLIGTPASNFIFKDSNNVDIYFFDLLDKADYTILVFWNSDCGHCQKEIPIIKSKQDSLKAVGAQVVSISTEQTDSTFKKFAAQNCHAEWITGWDPYGQSTFRRNYNIVATPRVFIIDKKEKKIKAKGLPVSDLVGYIEFLKRKEDPE
jgi:peroxiredoxin